MTTINNY